MQFNNDQFGSIRDCLTDSPFNVGNFDESKIPPLYTVYLIDNDGDYLIDNDGDYLVEVT